MTGMEKGIFQADEYQLPANCRPSQLPKADIMRSVIFIRC